METAKFWKVQVDTGKNDSKREINQGKQAIKDAKEPYFGSWRDVTVDNSLMSAAMTEELFKQGTKLTGIMCSNRLEIPQEFLQHSKREQY
jgi:hypothetical protein